jgi:hypothetical protein
MEQQAEEAASDKRDGVVAMVTARSGRGFPEGYLKNG